jgi:glycosyltransferase involved in cell wall biosynthesis
MQILHVIPSLAQSSGGAVQALDRILRLPEMEAAAIRVVATQLPDEETSLLLPREIEAQVFTASRAGGFRWSASLEAAFHRISQVDLIHSHLLWTHPHWAAARLARRRRIPHLISPCGTLSPGALRHRGWKKRLMAFAFQRRALREAACLHIFSELEAEQIGTYLPGKFCALIPPAILAPKPLPPEVPAAARERFGLGTETPFLLFLGRLHPVKNLPNLLHAWARTGESVKSWKLVLAGPDEASHQRELEQLAAELGIAERLAWTGLLSNAEVASLLSNAKGLGLPSRFENFGLAAVEALAAGVPVIASRQTPWSSLQQTGAGWWVESSPAALSQAIQELAAESTGQHLARQEAARTLARRFSPEAVSGKWEQLYAWLVGASERPSFVKAASAS